MYASEEIEARVAAIARVAPRDETGVARTEHAIAWLATLPVTLAVPALLPCVVARAWPAPFIATTAHRAGCARIARAAERALRSSITRVRVRDLINLDACARARPLWARAEDGYWRRWSTLDARAAEPVSAGAEDRFTVDAVLSTHPSGRLRESALARLDAHGVAGLPWMILRTLDWVAPIRARAEQAVLRRAADHGSEAFDALVDVLPLVLRVRGFTRADQRTLVDIVIDRVTRDPEAFLERGATHEDPRMRTVCLELLDASGAITLQRATRFLADPDLGVRLRAARIGERLAQEAGGGAAVAQLRATLSRDRAGRVRAIGLALAAETAPEDAVRELAMRATEDPIGAARELARALLTTRDPHFDLRAHYRAAVSGKAPRTGSVLGLGEVGRPEDWELLFGSLDGPAPLACAAIRAMRRLDRRESRETRLMMADDPRPGVVRAAVTSLEGDVLDSDERFISEYLHSSHAHVRRHAIRLAIQLAGWAPAHTLLRVRDVSLRPIIDSKLRTWLHRRFLHGAVLDPREATAIRAVLATSAVVTESTRNAIDAALVVMTRG